MRRMIPAPPPALYAFAPELAAVTIADDALLVVGHLLHDLPTNPRRDDGDLRPIVVRLREALVECERALDAYYREVFDSYLDLESAFVLDRPTDDAPGSEDDVAL